MLRAPPDGHLAEERNAAGSGIVPAPCERLDLVLGQQEDVLGERHLHHMEGGVVRAGGLDPQCVRLQFERGMAELGLDPAGRRGRGDGAVRGEVFAQAAQHASRIGQRYAGMRRAHRGLSHGSRLPAGAAR